MKFRVNGRMANALLMMTSLIWGSGFVVYKNMLSILSPFQFLALRAFFAAICAGVCLLVTAKRVSHKEMAAGITLGCILAAAGVVQTFGMQQTSAGNCAFLTGTNVVMVPFFSYCLTKSRLHKKTVLSAILMFLGVCLLTVDFESVVSFSKGDALSFGGAVLFAVHIAATEYYTAGLRAVNLLPIQFITLFVIHLLILLAGGDGFLFPVQVMAPAAYLGVVAIFVGHSIQAVCQERTDATTAAVLLSLEGVFGSLFGVAFLGERYRPSAVMAFAMIFAAILLSQINLNRDEKV